MAPAITHLTARSWYRVHWEALSAVAFNPGTGEGKGRFHPLIPVPGESPVGTLYAANTVECALAEAVLRHRTSINTLYAAELASKSLCVSEVVTEPLALIDLRGPALRRLNVHRRDLLDSTAHSYVHTAQWGAALYRWCPKAHGMYWVSQQDDRAQVLLLFADRAASKVRGTSAPSEALYQGDGLDRVRALATQSGICLVEG